MPIPSILNLPPQPTPDQIAKFVADAASEVIQTVTAAASSSQDSVETAAEQAVANLKTTVVAVNTAAQSAFNDLRANADRSKNAMQSAADRAVADFQILVNEVLKVVGHVPSPADLAIGDVNGEQFFEPLSCFVLVMKAISEDKQSIKLRLREPTVAQAFRDLVGATTEEIAQKAREKLIHRIPANTVGGLVDPVSGTGAATATAILAAVPPAVWIILAIAVVVLAVAVSIFVVLMAIAIIYALYKGYNVKDLGLDFHTPLFGITFGVTLEK